MKKIILFLALAVSLSAQNFKHESGGVTGIESYSEGTVETDTLRTRYIRLLDGLNSDSIASYIYFDGDTSRWAGDPIKIGNNSIIIKDDTVKISNAMLTVSGQVQADTLVPYHNSTIYVRHFTVDTIEIVKYIHQQEVAQFDSVAEWVGDGDTFRIDASINANVIEYEDENVTKFAVDSTGKVGIGTGTPIHSLSIVNSGGLTNALHIVNSTINKNRTTQAQSADSASIWLGTLSTGRPMFRMRAADGVDTLAIGLDGSTFNISSNVNFNFTRAGLDRLQLGSSEMIVGYGANFAGGVLASNNDTYDLGSSTKKWKELHVSDNGYIGSKGQTATLTVGTQNIMTEQTDSCTVITPINGSGSIKLASAAGAIVTDMGVQPATYSATIGDMWLSRNGGTTPRDTLWIKVTADSSAYVVFGARELKH